MEIDYQDTEKQFIGGELLTKDGESIKVEELVEKFLEENEEEK